jgi:hypothetical protein
MVDCPRLAVNIPERRCGAGEQGRSPTNTIQILLTFSTKGNSILAARQPTLEIGWISAGRHHETA